MAKITLRRARRPCHANLLEYRKVRMKSAVGKVCLPHATAASANASGRTLALLFFRRGPLRLEPLHEDLRGPCNVIAAELFRFRSVARDDGVQDRDMLTENDPRHLLVV